MIGKGKSISHGAQGIDYALNKENAQVIERKGIVGDNGREIKAEFRIFQNLNSRASNKDLSFVLSPEPNDGRVLTDEDYRKISKSFLDRMGLGSHQSITIKHTDREHTHLHIFANRINHNGKAYRDGYISKRAQRTADEVAKQMGIIRARDVQALNKAMGKELRREIFHRHQTVLGHRPEDFAAYRDLMRANGVKVIPTVTRQGKLQGFRVAFGGVEMKASAVNRSMTLSKMGVGIGTDLNPKLNLAVKVAKFMSRGMGR